MPIYEYQCKNCQHQLEVIQKMDDPVLTECPVCKKASLEKKVSAAGFQLKGTGWYVTDFKGGAKTQASKDQPDHSPAAVTTSETKSSSDAKE